MKPQEHPLFKQFAVHCEAQSTDLEDLPGIWFPHWESFVAGAAAGASAIMEAMSGPSSIRNEQIKMNDDFKAKMEKLLEDLKAKVDKMMSSAEDGLKVKTDNVKPNPDNKEGKPKGEKKAESQKKEEAASGEGAGSKGKSKEAGSAKKEVTKKPEGTKPTPKPDVEKSIEARKKAIEENKKKAENTAPSPAAKKDNGKKTRVLSPKPNVAEPTTASDPTEMRGVRTERRGLQDPEDEVLRVSKR